MPGERRHRVRGDARETTIGPEVPHPFRREVRLNGCGCETFGAARRRLLAPLVTAGTAPPRVSASGGSQSSAADVRLVVSGGRAGRLDEPTLPSDAPRSSTSDNDYIDRSGPVRDAGSGSTAADGICRVMADSDGHPGKRARAGDLRRAVRTARARGMPVLLLAYGRHGARRGLQRGRVPGGVVRSRADHRGRAEPAAMAARRRAQPGPQPVAGGRRRAALSRLLVVDPSMTGADEPDLGQALDARAAIVGSSRWSHTS